MTRPQLPTINKPDPDKFRNVIWFMGLDPAVKVDSFGIVVHGLKPKPKEGGVWNPQLREVYEIKAEGHYMTDVITWITNSLFRCYPPTYCIIDATRDTPTAQDMERRYGENTVKAMSMTNKLNYEMKQNGFSYLEQGYTWPNTAIMKNREKATAISDLQLQTLQERSSYTDDNNIKFSHPPGKHNDLNRAWEMSLKAVRDFQMGLIGKMSTSVYDDYPTEEILEDEPLKGTFALPFRDDE